MKPLVILGVGGFGREVAAMVAAVNAVTPTWDLVGVLDDNPSDTDIAALASLGHHVIGAISRLPSLDAHAVIGIGSPAVRFRLDAQYPKARWATLVHPDATVGPQVHLAAGTIIAAGARLSTAISAGRHVQVDHNVTVGHDVVLGDHVRLNPQACVSGGVTVGRLSLVGASAVILEGRRVGSNVMVGAGAVVTKDVSDGITVKGVPAR